jgi:hypothetical protein
MVMSKALRLVPRDHIPDPHAPKRNLSWQYAGLRGALSSETFPLIRGTAGASMWEPAPRRGVHG